MNKRAKKHLEIALGGNMNIASLKPLALIEIMTDFAKKEVEAINYTHCCETLKDKYKREFREWVKDNFERNGNMYLSKSGNWCKERNLEAKYKTQLLLHL